MRNMLVGIRFGLLVLALLVTSEPLVGMARASDSVAPARIERPLIITQLPAGSEAERQDSTDGGALRLFRANGARLVLVEPDSSTRVLSSGFQSACDPDVSFDGKRILFAAKKRAEDAWNIHEMAIDGSHVRQITRNVGDCRSPGYQSTLYTIVSSEPWYQITFVGTGAGTLNEDGSRVATNLYSCKLDGSAVRRLTFNLSSDVDPFLMPDGRLLYAGWQRSTLDRGTTGRVALFGVNIDGADHALFADTRGRRIKRMPCITTRWTGGVRRVRSGSLGRSGRAVLRADAPAAEILSPAGRRNAGLVPLAVAAFGRQYPGIASTVRPVRHARGLSLRSVVRHVAAGL